MSASPSFQANGLASHDAVESPAPPRPRPRSRRRGVLLINLGTPDGPDTPSVRRYLSEFLADPDVIRLPRHLRWMNGPLAWTIARFRGAASAEAYETIWTERGSPLKVITEDQVDRLQEILPDDWQAFYAMRYGRPSIGAALDAVVEAGVRELVVIPMYPQFSGPTTGTALDVLYEELKKRRELHVTVRTTWYDDVAYIDAQAHLIHEFAEQRDLDPSNALLLFSTHSMPESYIRDGDPYQRHVLRTVGLVTERLGWAPDRTALSYQSKLGPVPWLSPGTEQTLLDLAKTGEPNVIVCPVSFTADCLETLEEIGIRYREEFEAGGGTLHLCPALNTFEPFVKALSHLTLRGPRPVSECACPPTPLMRPSRPAAAAPELDVDSLVMVGVSLKPPMPNGHGPKIEHVTPETFQSVKRPYDDVSELLRRTRSSGGFDECWLWNTCSRFEFYGWPSTNGNGSSVDDAVAHAVSSVAGESAGDLHLNVLRGRDAWHHLMRTATGLNSGLPGDKEVVDQLQAAHRLAESCETGGPRSEQLMREVLTCQDLIRGETAWGKFQAEYCPVVLKRVALAVDLEWANLRHVVIGGSVTARSLLSSLRTTFGVPAKQITLVHRTRCRGRQLKRIRAVLGGGQRLRVDRYGDRRVLDAIADADVVYYATDARQPLHGATEIGGTRDLADRPLTVIDFNTFGSTDGLESLDGVTVVDASKLEREAKQYAGGLFECPAFGAAAHEAESVIGRYVSRISRSEGQHHGTDEPHHLPVANNGSDHDAASSACPCRFEHEPRICPRRLLAERNAS